MSSVPKPVSAYTMDRFADDFAAVTGELSPGQPVHVLLCLADHYEPKLGRPSASVADERVRSWVENYPRLFARFRDSDGRPPRHTFFYPPEEYEPEYLDALAGLCGAATCGASVEASKTWRSPSAPPSLRQCASSDPSIVTPRSASQSRVTPSGATNPT